MTELKKTGLMASHYEEADRRNAIFFDMGWSLDDTMVCSKTSKGYLTSVIDCDNFAVTHEWQDYEA